MKLVYLLGLINPIFSQSPAASGNDLAGYGKSMNQVYQVVECDLNADSLQSEIDLSSTPRVIGQCCAALKTVSTILNSGTSDVRFNGLCDQYAYNRHCWSAIENTLKEYHEKTENDSDKDTNKLKHDLRRTYELLDQACPNNVELQSNIYSDDDFCEKTSRVRSRLSRKYCKDRKYMEVLDNGEEQLPGRYCRLFNIHPYTGMCRLYHNCRINRKNHQCVSITRSREWRAQHSESSAQEGVETVDDNTLDETDGSDFNADGSLTTAVESYETVADNDDQDASEGAASAAGQPTSAQEEMVASLFSDMFDMGNIDDMSLEDLEAIANELDTNLAKLESMEEAAAEADTQDNDNNAVIGARSFGSLSGLTNSLGSSNNVFAPVSGTNLAPSSAAASEPYAPAASENLLAPVSSSSQETLPSASGSFEFEGLELSSLDNTDDSDLMIDLTDEFPEISPFESVFPGSQDLGSMLDDLAEIGVTGAFGEPENLMPSGDNELPPIIPFAEPVDSIAPLAVQPAIAESSIIEPAILPEQPVNIDWSANPDVIIDQIHLLSHEDLLDLLENKFEFTLDQIATWDESELNDKIHAKIGEWNEEFLQDANAEDALLTGIETMSDSELEQTLDETFDLSIEELNSMSEEELESHLDNTLGDLAVKEGANDETDEIVEVIENMSLDDLADFAASEFGLTGNDIENMSLDDIESHLNDVAGIEDPNDAALAEITDMIEAMNPDELKEFLNNQVGLSDDDLENLSDAELNDKLMSSLETIATEDNTDENLTSTPDITVPVVENSKCDTEGPFYWCAKEANAISCGLQWPMDCLKYIRTYSFHADDDTQALATALINMNQQDFDDFIDNQIHFDNSEFNNLNPDQVVAKITELLDDVISRETSVTETLTGANHALNHILNPPAVQPTIPTSTGAGQGSQTGGSNLSPTNQNAINEHVAVCDGNLKMTIYISSTEPLKFENKNYFAGKCDSNNPGIYFNTYTKYDIWTTTFIINLDDCHPDYQITGSSQAAQFNKPLEVSWEQYINGEKQTVTIHPHCQFTNDYIVDKAFDHQSAVTRGVVGNTVNVIDDNLQFEFTSYTDDSYTTELTANTLNPNTVNYIQLKPSEGFNPYIMVNVPTTCWILDTRHKAYKLFNIPEDPICDYPKYFNHKWGSWKFAIDMPHIQDQQGNYLVVDPGMTGANFMIECAVKICPNFIGNICESLIRQCNYEDIDIEE